MRGDVVRHGVDVVGQVPPDAGHATDLGPAAQAALGTDFAGDPGDLAGERGQLVDHRVDGALQFEDLAARVHVDLLARVAVGDRGRDLGDVAHLRGEVVRHGVDVVGQVPPDAGHATDLGPAAQAALGTDFAGDPGDLAGERGQLVDHRVDGALQFEDLAARVHVDLLARVAVGDRGRDLGDVAHLRGEVVRHGVDVVGQVPPDAGHATDLGPAAQAALGTDFAGDPGDLAGERGQLVDHRVDRALQFEDLAARVHVDLLARVAVGDRGRDLGDVAHLRGEVVRHGVDVVGQVPPDAGHATDLGPAAQAALGTDFAGDPGDLAGERGQLVDHRVDGALQFEDLAARVHVDLLARVAVGDRGRDLGDVAHLRGEVVRHGVDVVGQVPPDAGHATDLGPAAQAALGTDFAGDPGDLAGERGQLVDHRVDRALQFEDLAARVHVDLLARVAVGDRGRDLGDVAHLRGEVVRHGVDVVGQVPPDAGHATDLGPAAQAALGTDFAGDPGDLAGERGQLVDHRVDGALQFEDLAARVHVDLLARVAVGDRGRDLGDVAHLRGEVVRHGVDVVGQVPPDAGHATDLSPAAQAALGTDFAGDPGDLTGERGQLVDHRVDRALQFEDLAARVHVDLLGQVPVGYRCGDLGDVAHLRGEVVRHGVDVVGQVPPDAGHATDLGPAAQAALGTDFAGDPGDLTGERGQLVDHRVDGA